LIIIRHLTQFFILHRRTKKISSFGLRLHHTSLLHTTKIRYLHVSTVLVVQFLHWPPVYEHSPNLGPKSFMSSLRESPSPESRPSKLTRQKDSVTDMISNMRLIACLSLTNRLRNGVCTCSKRIYCMLSERKYPKVRYRERYVIVG
jgi:hypothetical protein